MGTTRGGKQAHYDWTLPSYLSLRDEHYCYPYKMDVDDSGDGENNGDNQERAISLNCFRMVFRIRYNMSTMDYDPFKTNSTHDYEPNEGILSPIEQNPEVDVGFYVQGLQLAINTAQTGRTFQDRSHTFLVCNRPSVAWENKELINVNVRGKRGNIVQTFPATEYDFEPQHVEASASSGTCYHFQWCGSNTHNNGAPGGDGQTGDDGEGRGGSDRSNLVQMAGMDQSYPVPYDTMRYEDELLNNVSASFRAGLICCLRDDLSADEEKTFAFLSTRNNNFSNRSQKWKFVLTATPDAKTLW